MDYKEKLEEAKRLYETATADQKYLLESLFPKLKSRANERIMANCIHFLNLQKSHHASTVEIDECIDWLEKQCEQRSVETIEPKFKVGDWVVNNNGEPQLFQVTERSWPDSKIKRAEDILGMFINTATLDEQYHLWTISDAKNGDVLATDDWVFIFEKIRSNGKPVCYCHYDVDLGFVIDVNTYISTGSTIRPATKEQRDILFQKMKEAGYEWNAEELQLEKVEHKVWEHVELVTEDDKLHLIMNEPKQDWSEDDETMCSSIIDTEQQMIRMIRNVGEIQKFFVDTKPFEEKHYKEIRWIESIKNRLQSKSLWKPTDEQIGALEEAIGDGDSEILISLYNDLKQL